jgi:hypothetical protein
MILICLAVLAVVATLVMEQWWGTDVNGFLSDHIRKSVVVLGPEAR